MLSCCLSLIFYQVAYSQTEISIENRTRNILCLDSTITFLDKIGNDYLHKIYGEKNYEVNKEKILNDLKKNIGCQCDGLCEIQESDTFLQNPGIRTLILMSESTSDFALEQLISELNLFSTTPNTEELRTFLGKIHHTETIFLLEQKFSNRMIEISEEQRRASNISEKCFNYDLELIKERLKLIQKRCREIFEANFSLYRYKESAQEVIKAININLDNDVFQKVQLNEDRDYTGGARIEILTDFLQMDLFPRLKSRRPFYNYQGIFFGTEAYTPEFQERYKQDTTCIYCNERPFFSFQYFGRSKYKIHRHGIIRSFGQIKIGTVGGERSKGVQYAIHRDITVSSSNPYCWDKQIAAGGRLGYSLEYYPEFMLFSNTGDIFQKLRDNRLPTKRIGRWLENLDARDFNAYVGLNLKYGTDQTLAGFRFGISNKNFREQGGILSPNLRNPGFIYKNLFEKRIIERNNFIYNFGIRADYIQYNSHFRGYGVTSQLIDENPNSPRDVYTVAQKDLYRWVFQFEALLGLRIRNTTFYYKNMGISPECAKELTNKWHWWGVVGLNFTVPNRN